MSRVKMASHTAARSCTAGPEPPRMYVVREVEGAADLEEEREEVGRVGRGAERGEVEPMADVPGEPGEARPGRGAVAAGDEPLQLGLELGEEEVDREVLIERALVGTRVRVGDESLAEGAREGLEARGERRDVLVPRGLAGQGVPDRRRGHEVAPEGLALRAHPVGEERVREDEVGQASREGALRLGHEGHRDSLGALRRRPSGRPLRESRATVQRM